MQPASAQQAMGDPASLVEGFRRMLLIRRFEERCVALNQAREFPGLVSVAIGQEPLAVALGYALDSADLVFTTHRNHAHILGRGGDPARVLAEVFGKATGYCSGKGGTFHVAAAEVGIPLASAIVAAGTPIATGAALAFKLRGEPRVVLSFLGDRALNEGTAWEAFNLASLWQVPLVFLCENNDAVPYDTGKSMLATDRIAAAVQGFRMRVSEASGTDLVETYRALREAVAWAREGKGPAFLEVLTPKWPGALRRDEFTSAAGGTRLAAAWEGLEEESPSPWERLEPIVNTARQLIAEGHVDRERLESMDRQVLAEVEAAVEFARRSPPPASSDAFLHVRSA